MIKTTKNKIYRLLRWSEKWTKTDMVYLAKGGGWITLGKIISTFSGLLLAIIYANFLPKEEYATYKYLLSMAGLFIITTLPGIGTSLTKSIAKGYEGSFEPAIKTRLKWSITGTIIALAISIYYHLNNNSTLSAGFLIISITMPIINSLTVGPFIQGKKLWRYSTIYNIIKNLTIFAFIAITVFFYQKAIPILIASYISATIIQIYFYFFTLKKYKLNKEEDKQCIPFGKHLSLMSVLGTIAEHIDKIIIWQLLGATQLAIYSFAIIPVNLFRNFLKSSSILAFPKIAQQDIKIIKKTLPTKIIKFTIILLPLILIYIISSPYLYKLIFPEYIESIKYSQLFALSLLFFPQRLISHTIISATDTKHLYILKTLNPLIKITLFSILIPIYSINGAIFSILLSSITSLMFLSHFFKKL